MLWERTAVELSGMLARGEVRSVEIVEALQARADAVEPKVRAFTAQHRDAALTRARELDAERAAGRVRGPLHGLPITVKENLALVGTPSTVGVKARAQITSTTTAATVQVALDGGVVILGKTNVPQLLLAMESHNDIWGTTFNPWQLDRTPGGSSGGEAAAIASGMSPLGFGTDIGGSIRNPAAWCGICGVKPTWGRWPMLGSMGGQPGQEAVKAQMGPLARTVDDVILAFQALTPEALHAADPLTPPLPLPDPCAVDLRGMRIGVYEDDGILATAASVRRAVREAADALRAAGAEVVAYTPPASWEMFDTYFGLMSADGTVTARGVVGDEPVTPQLRSVFNIARLPGLVRRVAGQIVGAQGEVRVARLLAALGEKRVHQVWKLVVQREAQKRAELAAWKAAGVDLVIGPPTVTPAAICGETHDWSVGAWNTMRWNLLDQPAGVVPVSRVRPDEQARAVLGDRLDKKAATFEANSVGLPVSVQVIGRPWEEHLVLAAMRAIEAGASGRDGFPKTPVTPA